MIFVTVGTHEQPFNRLVGYMDKWAAEHDEEVIIQNGFTKTEIKNCKSKNIFDKEEFDSLISKARLVITHGGPCCFTSVLKTGKIPIVVPRQHKLGEHVDDHQVDITREVSKKYNNIIVVEDIDKLGSVIADYDKLAKGMNNTCIEFNNGKFCEALSRIVDDLFD